MRVRSPKDFWAGLIFVAIGGGFVLLAQEYRLGDMHRMGPALFPSLVGALLAALGAFIALRAFALDGPPVPRFEARPILMSLLAIVLFAIWPSVTLFNYAEPFILGLPPFVFFSLIVFVAVPILLGVALVRKI